MVRSELVQRIADENPHLSLEEAERVVDIVFDQITETLAKGGRVELRGFGAFSVKHREARIARNPRSGESVSVPEKHIPFFKAGKGILQRMNPGGLKK